MIVVENIPCYFFNSIIITVSTPLIKFSDIKKEEAMLRKISYWNDTKLHISPQSYYKNNPILPQIVRGDEDDENPKPFFTA